MRNLNQLTGLLVLLLTACCIAKAQEPRSYPFRATNYDVEAILHPENQSIQAEAKVDLVAAQVGRTVVVELHPDLQVESVKSSTGQMLSFGRDNNQPIYVSVNLPEAATPGKTISLTFDYDGPVSSLDDSPTPGVRFASIDKTSAYLLLPARWFPLTNYPSNRYTGTFKMIVPDTFVVAGTGKSDPPTSIAAGAGRGPAGIGNQLAYTFHCDQAGAVGSFVAGPLQLTSASVEGSQFAVYTPQAQAATATPYAQSANRILDFFNESFGPLPAHESFTIAQMPDGTLEGYSAPGLLLLSARDWSTAKPNEGMLAQLAAAQWWGNSVLPATLADSWVTDGLAHYGQAMYAEQSDGVAGLHNTLQNFAVGALMYENVTPVSQVQNIGLYSDQYRSIVSDKGAMIFHMLRSSIGDDAFNMLLRDFYTQHSGKTATIEQFETLASAHAPQPKPGEASVNLNAFFSQWLNSTGVPEFTVDYIEYRTPKGFQVVGKIKQDMDTFRMPVDVRIETEGNPVTKKILVTGTNSNFEVDTFGRPKPNGVTIDPDNNLLKSSPHLRVLSLVARGESLASNGKYYEAIQEYQHALDVQPTNSLAHFRMAEAMFYQKNYNSSANEFRAAIGGDLDPKWVEVWGHIYMGKIYDLLGQRERAVNEYSLAQHLKDDTAGAQEEAQELIRKPYGSTGAAATATASASPAPGATTSSSASSADSANGPTLKRRTE